MLLHMPSGISPGKTHWILARAGRAVPHGRRSRHWLHMAMAVLLGKASIVGLVEGCLPSNVGSRPWILPRGDSEAYEAYVAQEMSGQQKVCIVQKYPQARLWL